MPGFKIGGSGSGPPNTKEFYRQHRWKIQSLGFPPGVQSSTTTASDSFTLIAKSIELPAMEFEEETVDGASLNYKFPATATFKDVTISLYDTYGLHRMFDNWQKLIWTPEEGIKPANNFMNDVIFVLTDGQGETKRTYTLKNAYPKSISHGELSYASSEVKLLNVIYAFHYMTIIHND